MHSFLAFSKQKSPTRFPEDPEFLALGRRRRTRRTRYNKELSTCTRRQPQSLEAGDYRSGPRRARSRRTGGPWTRYKIHKMSTVCGSRTDGRPSQLAKGRSLAMHDLTDRVCMRLCCSSGFGDEPVLLLPVALAFIALVLFASPNIWP